MGDKNRSWALHGNRIGEKKLKFHFTTDGSGDPLVSTSRGATFAHTGTPNGKYTVTLPKSYVSAEIDSLNVSVDGDAATSRWFTRSCSAGSGTTAGSVVFQTQSAAGTDAKLASATIDLVVSVKENALTP